MSAILRASAPSLLWTTGTVVLSTAARRHTQTALTWATIALGFAIGSAIFAVIGLVAGS